jgi:hypothetical protein
MKMKYVSTLHFLFYCLVFVYNLRHYYCVSDGNHSPENINLYFPINPMIQKLYSYGFNGGYGAKRNDRNRGKIINFKYPFLIHNYPKVISVENWKHQ